MVTYYEIVLAWKYTDQQGYEKSDICDQYELGDWNKAQVIKQAVSDMFRYMEGKGWLHKIVTSYVLPKHPQIEWYLELRESYRESRENFDEYNFEYPMRIELKDGKVVKVVYKPYKETICRKPKTTKK